MSLAAAAAPVDLAALARWMDGRGLGEGPIADVVPLGGGTQNIILRFRRGERGFVLRRPPLNLRANSNETMRREARILAALAGTGIPHAELIAACDDVAPLGATFYLMAPVDGVNAGVVMPETHQAPAFQHAMGLAMVDAAAALGEVDPFAQGLGDLGRPEGFLERQAPRWLKQLEGYRELAGWPGPDSIPMVGEIARWLGAHVPRDFRPGILHGDYHLANVLFRRDRPELAAILDWELATIGDPLIDLGWMVATWAGDDGAEPVVEVTPWNGFPKTGELVERYASRSSRDLSAMDWYVVLASFKLGVILEGTYARACAGLADREVGERLHRGTVELFERAAARIG